MSPSFALLERFTFTGLTRLPPTWAIAAAGGFVLLLYILRLRRRQVEVPFSRLWARVLQDREPTSFWRRLKRLLSMLLQIAIIAMLLGAISDPRDKTELKRGRHILVLLDTSASMQAVDAPPKKHEEAKGPRSRIDTAKREVRELIKNKRRNDYMMLVRMDGQVTPVTSWTRDAAVLEEALGKTEPAETASDIGRGLRFAADTLRGMKDPILVLVGDGQYDAEQLRCVFWGSKPPPGFNCETGELVTMKLKGKPKERPAAMRPAPMRPKPKVRRRRRRRAPKKKKKETPRLKAPRPEIVAAERFIDPISMGKIKAYAILIGKDLRYHQELHSVAPPPKHTPSTKRAPCHFVPHYYGGTKQLGFRTTSVPSGGLCDLRLGLREGDVLTHLGGAAVTEPRHVQLFYQSLYTAPKMRVTVVRKPSNNVGIIAFNARRNPADKFSHQLFVKVKNHRKRPVRVNLLVSTGAVLPENVPLEIGPGETRQYIKKGLPAAGKRMTGRLEASGGRKKLDDFPLDDKAYALLPKRQKSKVLLVSKGNLYIEGTLLLDEENVSYQRIMPAAWTPGAAKKYDAVIFDDFTPAKLPKAGNFLFFDPRGANSPVKIAKRVKDPEIWWPLSDKDKRHQIMDYIRVKDVRALESSVFETQRKDVPLIRLDERGAVYALLRKTPGRKIVVVGFSSQQTNWVMRIGFPVFILNTIAYFAGENTRLIHTYRTGETWQIPMEVADDMVEVTDPKKKKFKAPLKDGKVTFYGRHIGFHTITTSLRSVQIAANLANPAESDITARGALVLSYDKFARELVRPDLKEDIKESRISTKTVLLTVLLAGIGLVLLGFGLYGGRTGVLWVFLGILLLAAAVIIVAFAAEMRPWTGLLLAVAAMLLTEWLTYNRRVTV